MQFTSTRLTPVDLGALVKTLLANDATAVVYNQLGTQVFFVEKATVWTGPQVTFVQNAIDAAPELTPQRQAQNEIDGWPIALRALVLALIDQLNFLRSKMTPPLGAMTPAQAMQVVRDKAGTL